MELFLTLILRGIHFLQSCYFLFQRLSCASDTCLLSQTIAGCFQLKTFFDTYMGPFKDNARFLTGFVRLFLQVLCWTLSLRRYFLLHHHFGLYGSFALYLMITMLQGIYKTQCSNLTFIFLLNTDFHNLVWKENLCFGVEILSYSTYVRYFPKAGHIPNCLVMVSCSDVGTVKLPFLHNLSFVLSTLVSS